MGVPLLPKLLCYINRIIFGAYIPASAKIGKGVRFSYGGAAVVVHSRAVIGNNCTIGPAVTIGRRKGEGAPVIEDNVFLAGGVKILGEIVIGEGSIVAANSVVIKGVPKNSVVAGIPAKIVRTDIDRKDYITW
jgi:serine O-acetyltransferase